MNNGGMRCAYRPFASAFQRTRVARIFSPEAIRVFPRLERFMTSPKADSQSLDLKQYIRDIPDFPKPGILFRDVTPLLSNAGGVSRGDPPAGRTVSRPEDRYDRRGGSSRLHLCGTAARSSSAAGFVPVRKPGKLPFERLTYHYALEYGSDTLEMHVDAVATGHNVLVVDDLLATGGTVKACCELVEADRGDHRRVRLRHRADGAERGRSDSALRIVQHYQVLAGAGGVLEPRVEGVGTRSQSLENFIVVTARGKDGRNRMPRLDGLASRGNVREVGPERTLRNHDLAAGVHDQLAGTGFVRWILKRRRIGGQCSASAGCDMSGQQRPAVHALAALRPTPCSVD